MLVLQRKLQQSVLIGDNIKITILDSGVDGVKLAIDAPKNIAILREELVEAAKINQEAVLNNPSVDDLKKMLLQ